MISQLTDTRMQAQAQSQSCNHISGAFALPKGASSSSFQYPSAYSKHVLLYIYDSASLYTILSINTLDDTYLPTEEGEPKTWTGMLFVAAGINL